jgi:hypothetical protein
MAISQLINPNVVDSVCGKTPDGAGNVALTAADVGANPALTFTQMLPAAVWNISHTLGGYPSVTIVDSAGSVVIGSVQYLSSTVLQISFSAAFAGSAYLN